LMEAGASYTDHGFDAYSKPAWYAQVNPLTGKIPAITYGGPNIPPDEPSPLSFKLTESLVILEFLADLFPESKLLPPATDPVARARVRLFIDVFARSVEAPVLEFLARGSSDVNDKIVAGLARIQSMLPDPDATDGGKFATGNDFTNADCTVVPFLALLELATKTDLGRFEPGTGKKLGEELAAGKFERLRRYQRMLLDRESVKKAIDLDHIEGVCRTAFNRN